jgi:iron complex outermembrane receptor protein
MNTRLSPIAAVLAAGFSSLLCAQGNVQSLGEVTVTGTREERLLSETPNTVGVVKEETIQKGRPTHPSQVLNQVPGVWLASYSGEGHATSIRHPLTTAAVYLYLEDGIPTRPTGFFNHNALYEVNVPQSGGMEVSKGPGSALYGSDAIGGTINTLTRKPPKQAEFEVSGEVGSLGWKRVLASGGNSSGDNAWRASVNLTKNDGWQDSSDYSRDALNLRWDRAVADDAVLKTIFAATTVDQRHVGTLNTREYNEAPKTNNIPFSYRKVEAYRLSTSYEKESGNSLISITPYYRDNSMKIIPSWSVSYDATQYDTKSQSIGFLSKYRHDFEPLRTRLIVGLDFDLSPGSRDEDSIRLTRTTNAFGGNTYAHDTASAPRKIYQYDVTYRSVSPYVHAEISPTENLRLIGGLRYDDMQFDYKNTLNGGSVSAVQGYTNFIGPVWFGRVADTKIGYGHWGPKLGATYALSKETSVFANYANSFRTPSESQLFRPSAGANAVTAQQNAQALLNLKPVIVDNYEVGVRGKAGQANYEVSVYRMVKSDDIVSYKDPTTNVRTTLNAGQSLHRGIEIGAGAPLAKEWRLDVSFSYQKQAYTKWSMAGVADYSGKEMEAAPRVLANTRLTYAPGYMNGGRVQLEWVKVGPYWLDAANTLKYAGHDLFNLRGNLPLDKQLEVWASVTNLLDKRYADSVGTDAGAAAYTVGLPRAAIIGLQAKW